MGMITPIFRSCIASPWDGAHIPSIATWSLARDLVQASHVAAPPSSLEGSCLGEPQRKLHSSSAFLPSDIPPRAAWAQVQAGLPRSEALPAFLLVGVWQSVGGPGAAALNSLSPLGTSWRGSIAKNQFQKVCQVPGNQASMQVPRGPSPRSSQSADSTPW